MLVEPTTALAIAIYANMSSLPLARQTTLSLDATSVPATLIELVVLDEASRLPATRAAAIWNYYHPNFGREPFQATVETVPPAAFEPSVIGKATCVSPCPADLTRWCCGRVRLQVVDNIAATQEVFFHEIGHVVIPPGATATDGARAIDAGGHWVPEEHHEIMGATLEFPTFTAPYTLHAPDATNNIVCGASCAVCADGPSAQLPKVCALAHSKPAPDECCEHDRTSAEIVLFLWLFSSCVCTVGIFYYAALVVKDPDYASLPPRI